MPSRLIEDCNPVSLCIMVTAHYADVVPFAVYIPLHNISIPSCNGFRARAGKGADDLLSPPQTFANVPSKKVKLTCDTTADENITVQANVQSPSPDRNVAQVTKPPGVSATFAVSCCALPALRVVLQGHCRLPEHFHSCPSTADIPPILRLPLRDPPSLTCHRDVDPTTTTQQLVGSLSLFFFFWFLGGALWSTPVASATASATSLGSSTSSYDASQHASPVVAFIIGFGIIMPASVLNAAGLNLTKLDHVSGSVPSMGLSSYVGLP
ncbi:hypothetical protein PISMIDRAFT_638153 [Pisolithus microcarpus 441]|uniref:Uncharacterized protein n=1 Tax=Pisolithus microcarpus 441 TaxID=765257 RepID=A0A0C9YGK7_9AGAM|nr:hypothetical protein PISMIDRAFT_638153 [Pisolithus microcarpus 441]